MNRAGALFAAALATITASFVGLVVAPTWQVSLPQQVAGRSVTAPVPAAGGNAEIGRRVYIREGCQHCHTQCVRPAELGTDLARGWGPRRSEPRDYAHADPPLLGSIRTGPDLSDIGSRMPDDGWHNAHLLDARSVASDSTMPPFAYLFEQRTGSPALACATNPRETAAPLPSQDARALVAYLRGLRMSRSGADVARGGVEAESAAAAGQALAAGRRLYAACQGCHQANGAGVTDRYPALVGSRWLLNEPEIPVHILLRGLRSEVPAGGVRAVEVMPAWGYWSDRHIAWVLSYARCSWGNAAPEVTVTAVATVREGVAGQPGALLRAELVGLSDACRRRSDHDQRPNAP